MHPHSPNNYESRSRWPREQSTKVGVIGAGELGLRLALEFAERGHQVVCADYRGDRIAPPPNSALAERLRRNVRVGRLRFTSSSAAAARHGQVVVMAVETRADGAEDQAALLDAVVEAAQSLSGPALIVDESTNSAASAAHVARLLSGIAKHEIVLASARIPASRDESARWDWRVSGRSAQIERETLGSSCSPRSSIRLR